MVLQSQTGTTSHLDSDNPLDLVHSDRVSIPDGHYKLFRHLERKLNMAHTVWFQSQTGTTSHLDSLVSSVALEDVLGKGFCDAAMLQNGPFLPHLQAFLTDNLSHISENMRMNISMSTKMLVNDDTTNYVAEVAATII